MVQAFQGLQSIMEVKYDNWAVPLKVTPSIGYGWGDQIDLSGFTDDGTPIPDCDPEDLTLLG